MTYQKYIVMENVTLFEFHPGQKSSRFIPIVIDRSRCF